MQLILELLKKIFVALQGVYTKEESDSALAERDNRIANAEENLEQLNEALEANTANDNALTNVVKWQSYAAAMQSMVGETTAAQIAEEFERATNEYLADPTKTKEWYTSSTTESTNPHYSTASTDPIIDFAVVTASRGAVAVGSFNSSTNVPIFLPNVKVCDSMLYRCGNFNSPVYLPKAETLVQAFYFASKFNQPLTLPNATNVRLLASYTSLNQPVSLPKCSNAEDAFLSAKMSADNISATLDSLPPYTSGTHIITFTNCPGAAELTQESESVAAATAKGWTVEL